MFAVISDIHGNIEALETVLDYLHSKNINTIFCLGDLIGYGPDPVRIVDTIKKNDIPACLGNHDLAAIMDFEMERFNPLARTAMIWTKRQITSEEKNFLNQLNILFSRENCLFVHSSPYQPRNWDYVYPGCDLRNVFSSFKETICFIGHSHIPGCYCETGDNYELNEIKLDRKKKYIVNVGSVGQPRDGDPRLCFVIVDNVDFKINFIRLRYPVEKTQEKMAKYELPQYLIDRLSVGR